MKTISLHGRTIAYREAGEGPVLLLIHGMAGTSEGWSPVLGLLAREHTVIAPDFPGHGDSEPGGGDYSLGGLAAGLRDLLAVLGHDRATLVGHSLGGGVALQFAYRGLGAVGLRPNADVAEVARGYASLADAGRRRAFLSTLSSVVGTDGQRVAATDRLYLAAELPLLIVWGSRDPIIPARHAEQAHEALPGSRLEVFDGVGHLPQLEQPTRFIEVLEDFIASTEPADFDREEWRARFAHA
jgi:pimeloyl-ACP methyl ester carboxylesterase